MEPREELSGFLMTEVEADREWLTILLVALGLVFEAEEVGRWGNKAVDFAAVFADDPLLEAINLEILSADAGLEVDLEAGRDADLLDAVGFVVAVFSTWPFALEASERTEIPVFLDLAGSLLFRERGFKSSSVSASSIASICRSLSSSRRSILVFPNSSISSRN